MMNTVLLSAETLGAFLCFFSLKFVNFVFTKFPKQTIKRLCNQSLYSSAHHLIKPRLTTSLSTMLLTNIGMEHSEE